MLKTIVNMLAGALIAASVSVAFAVTGNVPLPGFGAIDGTWLLGLSGGSNFTYQYGITAHAGGGQSACFSLTPGIYLYEVDTVASANDSTCIPYAVAGTNFSMRNAAASNSMNVYAQPGTNLLTATTDQINGTSNTSAYALLAGSSMECFSAKNGQWSCVKGN